MDDKFLRDKLNEDDMEVPESLLPENISKLLENNAKNVRKYSTVKEVSENDGVKEVNQDGNAQNVMETADEKAVNELGKRRRKRDCHMECIWHP